MSHRDIFLLESNDSPLHLHQNIHICMKINTVALDLSMLFPHIFCVHLFWYIKWWQWILQRTFFFNQSNVFSLLYRWNFRLPTSGNMTPSINRKQSAELFSLSDISFMNKPEPFSSAMWCMEASERVQLRSLEHAGNSSSITTWSTGWNFPWAEWHQNNSCYDWTLHLWGVCKGIERVMSYLQLLI